MIVSPLGEMLAGPELGGEAILTAELDLDRIARASTTSTSSATTPGPTSSRSPSTSAPSARSCGAALHLTNGDATVPGILGTGLAETVLPWRDALHEGPSPTCPTPSCARSGPGSSASSRRHRQAARARRRAARSPAPRRRVCAVVRGRPLDQLQLAQILAMLHALGVPAERVTLICIGEHLGSAHFGGLGELGAEQLGRLRAPPSMASTAGSAASTCRGAPCRGAGTREPRRWW